MSGNSAASKRMVQISQAEALKLVASANAGRIAFHLHSIPRIVPVTHIVDAGHLVVRTHGEPNTAWYEGPSELVVVFETDDLNLTRGTGWSVNIAGRATTIPDADQLAQYKHRLTVLARNDPGPILRVSPDVVSGYRIVED